MYQVALSLHSWTRYAVVACLAYTLVRAFRGWLAKARYTRLDELMRIVTISAGHLQVVIGFALYFSSPLLEYFRSDTAKAMAIPELRFFGVIHIALMLTASVIMTIGGAKARRAKDDIARFRTLALYFLAAAIIILLAIPWPFSPLAARPWIRL